MKTEVQEVENEKNTVILKVEVPTEDIAASIKKAYKEVSQKVKIPGFRKGKVPPLVIDQMIGKDAVLNEAINDLIPLVYPEAVESSGIEPVSQPEIEIEQLEDNKPFVFTAKVQVKPGVLLGDYEDIRVPDYPLKVTKEDIDRRLNNLRDKFAQLEPVNKRAVKAGDFVLISYQGFIDGKPFEDGSGDDYMLEIGSKTFIPGFEDQLIGAKRGEEREIKVTFPENYHADHLSGQDAVFRTRIKEIKEKKLPKLNDEFAKNVSQFDTFAELKREIRKNIADTKKRQAESQKREDVINFVTDLVEVEIPFSMVERQIDFIVKEFEMSLKREKKDLSSYLAQMGDTLENFRNNFRDEASRRVKTDLVLDAIIKDKKMAVSDEEAEAEIKRLAENASRDLDEIKAQMTPEHINYLKSRLLLMKAVDYLVSKAKTIKKDEKR